MKNLCLILALFVLCGLPYPALADFEVNLNKGLAAYLNKDYKEAIRLLEQALSENPNSAVANHTLGLALYSLGNYDESIQHFEKAKAIDPNLKGINVDLGTAYLKAGDLVKAQAEFEEAISKDPQNGRAYYSLGYTQFKLGNNQTAVEYMDKAFKLDPEIGGQSLFYKGVSLYKLSDYQTAKSNFEKVREVSPNTEFASAAEEYLNAIARLTKKYYGTLSIGGQYDDNVLLEPNAVEISDQSDFRGVFFVNLGYKPYFKQDATIGLDYKGYISLHADITDFNIQDHRFSVYAEKRFSLNDKPAGFRVDYYYDLVLIDGTPADNLFSQSHSISPKFSIQWNNFTSTDVNYEFRYDNFEDFPERDALYNNISIGQSFRFNEGKILIRPGVGFALNSADDVAGKRNFDYYAPKAFLEGFALLPFGVTVLADTQYSREDYYNDAFDRVDNQIRFRVILSKKIYKEFFVDLGYQHVSNLSDSDVPGEEPFDYSRNVFSATLSVRF